MTVDRLTAIDKVKSAVRVPGYAPEQHGVGIVHLGLGAFHRAHQAVYTDDALAAAGGDWRIAGVSLRSTAIADALNPQNGLYTVLERGEAGTSARVIASIARAIAAARNPIEVLAALADPHVRIVSATVTEKAYGLNRASGTVDTDNPAIAADLTTPRAPKSLLGLIVEGLRRRREAAVEPFTVLCCDNLPENGRLIRSATLDFATRVDPALAEWIGRNVAFPSTMVDRITPASTEATLTDAERLIGAKDLAAVETEPFSQWVIEDRFPQGRPAWEAGGAILTSDVTPYEQMKLGMLNGTHSLIAYAGYVAGLGTIREAVAWPPLARLARRHLDAAAATLKPLAGVDFGEYSEVLLARFANPAIAHETYQVAMDGTEKLPQRLLLPALAAIDRGQDIRSFAFAVAAWMRYCLGRRESGETYQLRDPREGELKAAVERAGNDPAALVDAVEALPGLFPERLAADAGWRRAVRESLTAMLRDGMRAAIEAEARAVGDEAR